MVIILLQSDLIHILVHIQATKTHD